MEGKSSEWRPGPTVCRCCLSEGCYKDISTEYFWMGKREVYAEMLSETLSLSIAYSTSTGPNSNSRLICEQCISRLRDASEFKRQVADCEKTFMQHLDPSSSKSRELDTIGDVKVEVVKHEKDDVSEDDFDDRPDFLDVDSDDDLDNQPLTKLATKTPKKELDILDLLDNSQITVKRKSNLKTKEPPKKVAKKKESKPASSKASPTKPEKKKERAELNPNAVTLLKYSTLYPFRIAHMNLLCVYCSGRFSSPEQFRQHMSKQHQIAYIKLAFAHIRYRSTTANGERRWGNLNVDITDLKCRLCCQPCETLEDIAKHLKNSHEEEDFKDLDTTIDKMSLCPFKLITDQWDCVMCGDKSPTLHTLLRHVGSHFADIRCNICDKMFLSDYALNLHKNSSHSIYEYCRKCNKQFASKKEKRAHFKTSEKCLGYVCLKCGERFQSWEAKQKHMVDKHDAEPTTYSCPDCDSVFTSRPNFYYHYNSTHKELPYMCSYCGKRFLRQFEMQSHIKMHTGEGHKCPICDRKFSWPRGLREHMLIHENNRKYPCSMCESRFTREKYLKLHLKTVHKNK